MREMEKFPQPVQEGEKKKFKIAIVDDSEQVDNAARDAADRNLTRSEKDLVGIGGFFKKIWTHNLAKSYYQKKEAGIAKKKILDSGNVFVNENGKKEDHDREQMATTERFLSEYEEMVHKDAGEKKEVLGENESERAVQAKIKRLVMGYAEGSVSDECFEEEKTRILNEVKEAKKEVIGKGQMYADNMLEIAKQIKSSFEHGEKMEELDFDLEVIVGRAKSGVRTEAQYDAVDRLTSKIMESKVGQLVNETTVASALSIAYSLGSLGSRSLANSKLAAFGTFGLTALVGGGLAAARERKMLEDDRRQHFREMAQGKKFEDASSPRRKEMEQYRYETRDAAVLAQDLDSSLYKYDKEGKRSLKEDMSVAEFQVAFGQLAEIESRIALSDGKKIDLISFTDVKKIGQERLELDIARAEAKVNLRKCANSEEMKKVLNGKSVDEFLASLTETRSRQLTEGDRGLEKKNELFNACKKKETGKAFVKGVVTGLAFGAAVQEVVAFFNPSQTGMAENFFMREAHGAVDANGVEHYTPLEYARRWASEHLFGNHEFPRMDMRNAHETIIGATHVKLPQGVDLVPNGPGNYNLMQNGVVLNDHITFDANGNITPEAQSVLHDQGINIKSTLGQGTPGQFVQQHPDATTHIKRDLWYENNTARPVFDKNELKLWWGGHEGTGIDSHGNYVFNVKHMMPDGSYEGNFSVDAQEAMKEGHLKMIFSLSSGTQNHVIEWPIDANGNAIIDPNSETGKMLFENVNGHAKFIGKFAEVAQDMGQGNDGVEHVRILATHVGKGVEQIGTPIAVFDMPAPYEVDGPWIIPAPGRTPLEKVINDKNNPEYLNYYNHELSESERDKMKEDMSPRLKENSKAKLNPVEEVNWYFQDQERRYPGYIGELKKLYRQEDNEMSKNTEAAVAIAVAGHQEFANIYRTLETYAVQKNRNGGSVWQGNDDKFEIMLYVNWPKGSSPEQTISEIERFKKNNPNVKVLTYKEEINTGKVELGWYKKKLFDLALMRNSNRGGEKDILIVCNDADMMYSSEYYLADIVDEMNSVEGQKKDALLGRQDLDPEVYMKNPTFHAVHRFLQFLDATTRAKFKSSYTQGRNTVLRGSSYAAIGGNRTKEFWADVEFGKLLQVGRDFRNKKGQQHPVGFTNRAWVMVDPRREIDKFKKGEKLAWTWSGDFDTRSVRGSKNRENELPENIDVHALASAAENDPIVVKFKDILQEEFQEILKVYMPALASDNYSNSNNFNLHAGRVTFEFAEDIVKKAASYLGVKIETHKITDRNTGFNSVGINIVDTRRLRTRLDKYNSLNRFTTKIKNNSLFRNV